MASYSITVNGKTQEVEAMEDMPLLWVLRDLLNLPGTKFGCGKALCGACTVHVNGNPVRSCSYPISAVGKNEVTTIEGLSEDGKHPVQVAWEKLIVPQCGYCQTGQIMAAVALLKQQPNPTDQEIDQAMQGNICRCGTYNRIKAAIKLLAGGKTDLP